jgi:hypothetical protein
MSSGGRFALLCVLSCLALLGSGAQAVASTGGTAAPEAADNPGQTGGTSANGPVPSSGPVPSPKGAIPPPRRLPPARGALADVPGSYLRLYRAAASREKVDWRVLAAIGKLESDHGRGRAPGITSGVNFARCCAGPMQFCIVASCGRVWQYYAMDANGDGRTSVYDPADAIPAAAKLVRDLQLSVGRRSDFLLGAYNAGPGYIMRHSKLPPYRETQAYVATGLRYIKTLGAR